MEDEDIVSGVIDEPDEDETEELIEVCPVCGSPDLYYEAGGIEGLYHCKDCGYIGAFVIEANRKMRQLIRDEYERNLRVSE
ncbi:hypothetical protein [Methanolobus sp. WCC5]|uniref:hypothetical protein n=1 Tax=Methanolobus sp. WCC5 TaxID=3125785 RepID=UPI003250CBC4